MLVCDQFKGDTCPTDRLLSPKVTRQQEIISRDARFFSTRTKKSGQRGLKMFETGQILLVVLDITCVLLVGLPFFILDSQQVPHSTPFKRGFFCNDESIKYPYKEDTISYQLLGGVMIPFALIIIVCGEWLSAYMYRVKNRLEATAYLPSIYKVVGSYLFGAAANQSLTDIAKYTIGRLRPHFLAVCKPAWDRLNCKAGGYIENVNCTGDKFLIEEARLSFYSGHASFSMYCMLFLILYIQARLQSDWARLLRPTIQFFLAATAVYVGLSRVSDYKHHWSDVLVGLLHGGLVAVLTVFFVSDLFKRPVVPSEALEDSEATQTNLQENTTNGNHYGSTD